jgi:hypothetical protein
MEWIEIAYLDQYSSPIPRVIGSMVLCYRASDICILQHYRQNQHTTPHLLVICQASNAYIRNVA